MSKSRMNVRFLFFYLSNIEDALADTPIYVNYWNPIIVFRYILYLYTVYVPWWC